MGLVKYSTRSILNTLTQRFKSGQWKSSVSLSDSPCRPTNLRPRLRLRVKALSFQCNPSSSGCSSLQTSANNMTTKTQVNVDVIKEITLPLQALHTRANTSGNEDYLDHGHDTEVDLPTDFKKVIETTSECLLNGGVLGVPTDTIYGIAGLAQDCKAVNRIYDIKQRNYSKPLAISVGKIDDIYRFCKVKVPRELLNDLLPGPVTVVFERSPELNPELNPQTSLVGVRIPDHIFMQTLAIACNSPIALTSANVSGDKSCLQIEEFKHLWPLLDLVVNGGKLNDSEESRLGSTVVDLSVEGTYRIIRPGSAHIATCAVLKDKFKLKEENLETSSR